MARTSLKRVQAVFSQEQFDLLEEYARETGRSLSAVVRESIAQHLLADLEKARRRKAVERIIQGRTPVKDWPEMEKDLEAGRYAQCDAP